MAPDLVVKDKATSMVGKSEAELVATFGKPFISSTGEHWYLERSAVQTHGGYYQTQCIGWNCLTTSVPPGYDSKRCHMWFRVEEQQVRAVRFQGDCK